MAIEYKEIEYAYEFVSSDDTGSTEAYYDPTNCKIYIQSDYIDSDNEIPDDISDDKYILIPGKYELNLGRELVFKFVYEFAPEDLELIESYFSHRGAYSKFKSRLEKIDLLDKWHKFEEECEEKALREWCRENNIELSG